MIIRSMLAALLLTVAASSSPRAQSQTGGPAKEIIQRQVAPDLY